jgi:ATP synthase A chain
MTGFPFVGASSHMAGVLLASGNININNHVSRTFFGLSIELDIVWSTLIAGAIIVILGLLTARKASSGVPGKLQLFFETVVDQVNQLVESTVGPAGKRIVPLAVALFLFILTANWLEVIPSSPRGGTEYLPSPGSRNTRLRKALLPAVPILLPDQRDRGGHQAHHFGATALRKPVRRNVDVASHSGSVAGVHRSVRRCPLEAVRHVHRAHTGVHLLSVDDRLLRHGYVGG